MINVFQKCQHSHYLLCSIRFGDSNNSQGLPDLEGHVLYDHTLCRKREGGEWYNTLLCGKYYWIFTRFNYYCSLGQKETPAVASANSSTLISSTEKTCVFNYAPTGPESKLFSSCYGLFSSTAILAEAKNLEKWWGTAVVQLSNIFLCATLDGKYAEGGKKAECNRNPQYGCSCTCGNTELCDD